MDMEDIIESLALNMMRQGGFDPDNREEFPLEWDLNSRDSQYSICRDMAAEYVPFVIKELMQVSPDGTHYYFDEDDDENPEDSFLDEHGHIRREKTNTTSACLFIFMDAGTGNPRYVRDVREWLANVDKAGIPDDTEIEGQLYLDYDLKGPIETIECGECGADDIIIATHHH